MMPSDTIVASQELRGMRFILARVREGMVPAGSGSRWQDDGWYVGCTRLRSGESSGRYYSLASERAARADYDSRIARAERGMDGRDLSSIWKDTTLAGALSGTIETTLRLRERLEGIPDDAELSHLERERRAAERLRILELLEFWA